MKNENPAIVFSCCILLALVTTSGCAQSGLMTRPQPVGGEVINPWLSTQERKFNELEKSFQEQITRAEKLDPDSVEARKLKIDYEKIKRLWQLNREENANKFSELSELPDTFVNSVGITMKLIKPGTFMMGEKRRARRVTIAKPFYIGVYEVTGEQHSRVMGGGGSAAPKDLISWNEAMAFCKKLSEKEGLNYTLPTEAQWEYACRAGTTTAYSFGDKWNEAASRQSNPWGLYDMHGNVQEWCSDWYDSKQGRYVLRGGCFYNGGGYNRSVARIRLNPFSSLFGCGFRVVLLPD